MAMTYQNFASLGVNLNRQKYGPLDISSVFTTEADLKYYLSKGTYTEGVSTYWYKNVNEKIVPYPYEGQVIATAINDDVKVYVLRLDAEGNFEAKAIEPEVDGKTVKLTDGKLELVGLPTDTSKVYVPSLVNGVLTWAEPDTSTAEGQQQAIEGLTASVAGLSEVLNGKAADEEAGTEAVVGLVDKVAALEVVDNATQAELDAYKEVVTNAIAEALQEAKDYADENDANTVYDDSELSGRVDVIESDYLKKSEETIYNDAELRGRIETIESDYLKKSDETIYDDSELIERIESLEEAVEAIDYVDETELANALAPITEALGTKAAQSDLDTLKGRVDTFFEGTGVEGVVDTLEDLISFINTHDDVEISSILASIQAIENKLTGVDSTVVAYVTAAIEALKIGDYAKAADLTTLASRVEVLEAKPFDTYATKTEVETVDGKFANYTTTEVLTGELNKKADADKVVANETFESFKTTNSEAITAARSGAVSDVEAKGYAVASEVESTYATKSEVTEAIEGIENTLLGYVTNDTFTTELAKKADASSVYTKTEIDTKIGTPGVPAEIDSNGNELTPAVPGTGVFANTYSRAEVDKLLDEVQGGSSASADSVLRQLNTYKSTNDERVSTIEAKDAAQDTAIATAQTQADKGVADAKKVSDDLATANNTISANTREIEVVKGSITTVNETLSGEIANLKAKDIEIAGLISGLDTTVGSNATTIGEHTAAITALQNKDTELVGQISTIDGKFANYYDKDSVDAKIKVVSDAVGSIDFTPYATVEALNGVSSSLESEISRAKAAEEANTNAIAAIIGDDTNKTIREIAAEETAAIVAGADAKYDTLKEIADFILNDEAGAAAMANDITALKGLVDIEKSVSEYVSEQIAAIPAIPAATASTLGLVKVGETMSVDSEGTINVSKVSTDLLVQGEQELVLMGGSAK